MAEVRRGLSEWVGLTLVPNDKRILVGATIAGLALLTFAGSGTAAGEAPEGCRAKPYVVKIHADWCGSLACPMWWSSLWRWRFSPGCPLFRLPGS